MKVGDKYKVYIEVAPGRFEPIEEAVIKEVDRDNNQVKLIVPGTLVTMDTRVEIDVTPAPVQQTTQHVLLGTENADGVPNNAPGPENNSDGPQGQQVIASTPEGVSEGVQNTSTADTSAPVDVTQVEAVEATSTE